LTTPRFHVLSLIDTLRPGGAERSLATLAPHDGDLGIALDVGLRSDTDRLQDEIRSAGVAVFCVASSRRAGSTTWCGTDSPTACTPRSSRST
jgi:hypothetical protein